jgi:DNA-binding CsgD family transcriptional regulator
MNKRIINIIILENSEIIYEGLCSILSGTNKSFNFHLTDNFNDLEQINLRSKTDLVFLNPILIQNKLKDFQSLKRELSDTHWIGVLYAYIDPQLLTVFDEIININDPPVKINSVVNKLLASDQQPDNMNQPQDNLTEREIDVLKLLVAGNANKEIADKLNISTHTVISHRKNISQKTGIKSVSGLTIYAVLKNIITIENYRE